MTGPNLMILTTVIMLVFIVLWNKKRVQGKMLCFFVRKDKSVVQGLCKLTSSFVMWQGRAYDVYPDFIRVMRFPSGWPAFLQELVPASLYDEEDAVPLDWIDLDNRLERAGQIDAALDENWLKKLVKETVSEGGTKPGFNFKKALPVILIAAGLLVLGFILLKSGCLAKLVPVGAPVPPVK